MTLQTLAKLSGWSVATVLLLSGCAARDPFQAPVQGCATGRPGFAACMSSLVEPSDEARERRRWMARLQREQVEAEARVRRERAVAGLARP